MAEGQQPSADDLLAAIKEVKSKNPDFGLKRVLASVKESYAWEVSEKRVKKALQDLTGTDATASKDTESGQGTSSHGAAASGGAPWAPATRPTPRGYFTATYVEGERLIMFGGEYFDNKKNIFYNELFEFDMASSSFQAPSFRSTHSLPPSRSAHQACVWNGYLYIFGGEYSSPNGEKFKLYDDMWRFNLSNPCWERVQAGGGPSGRSGHRMTLAGDKLVLYGGMGENRYFQDLHLYDLKEGKWLSKTVQLAATKNKAGGSPGTRSGFVIFANASGDTVYIWGGTREKGRGTETLNDLWKLDMQTLAWTRVQHKGRVPGPRSGVAVCICNSGRCAMMCGGVEDTEDGGERLVGSIDIFDMQTDTWLECTGEGVKIGTRRNAACVGTHGGSKICLLGGLREEGKGKREKELTLDDIWCADVGQPGAIGAWKCLLALSGKGDVWHHDSDEDEDDKDDGQEDEK